MQHAGGQFLAGAQRATDQDAAVGGGHFLQRLTQLAHGGGIANHLGISPGAAFQNFDFAAQAEGFQRAADNEQQAVGIKRFFDIVISPALDGGDGGFDIAVAGNDDDGHIRVLFLDDIQEIKPIKPRVLQPDVEHNEPWPAVGNGRKAAV